MSIGDALAAARRQNGLTITQVSQRTCIRETIVRGIERGDYSACGGDFYARGHIRSIARAVGLEPEELIREYDSTQSAPRPISAADVFQPFTPVKLKERHRTNWSVVLLVGVLAVLGAAGFGYWSHNNKPKPKTTAATKPAHKAVTPPAKPVAHTTPRDIRLTLVANPGSVTWAQLTLGSGKVIFQGDVVAGTSKTWTERGYVTLQLGNPGGAALYLNGKRQVLESTNPIALTCSKEHCTAS